jgi:hypothetical protein
MAQTGYTPILIYSSSTASAAPVAGNLTNSTLGSELAINITDGKLFYKDNANAVQVIGWKTVPTSAGGTGLTSYTAGDLLYYATGTALTKLAIGAANTVLTSSGSAPQWSTNLSIGTLTTTGNVNINATPLNASANRVYATIKGTGTTASDGLGIFQFQTNAAGSTNPSIGVIEWNLPDNTSSSSTRVAFISSSATGTTANNKGSFLIFATKADGVSGGGTEQVRITSTGDVGIGTNSPATKLNLLTPSAVAVAVRCANNQSYAEFQVDSSGNTQIVAPGGNLILNTNGAERARVFASGGVSINNTTDPGAGNLRVTGSVLVNAVAGIGYATGAGGAVTQGAGSGKATTVTLDKPTGQITMNNANLNAGATVNFTCNCSQIAATDTVQINVAQSGAYTASNYRVFAYPTGGNFIIGVNNWSGGNLAEAIVLNYTILKGVAS